MHIEIAFDLIDYKNEEHIDYLLEHLECYSDDELNTIYKMLDLEIKQEAWNTYCRYNIRDVELVDKLEDKLKLIELVYAMAYDAKVNYQDTFTTVRAWDVIIHNYLLSHNTVVPQISVPEHDRGILGGYVKDPQVGLHKWVVSLDLNSLYPSIIQQYNISAETHVDAHDMRKIISEERRRRAK